MLRPLVVFYLLATAVSWSFWLPLMIYNGHHVEQSSLKYLHLLGELGPAISAIICCRYFGGQPALGTLIKRCLLWRVPLQWHGVAWLSPFALLAIALWIASLWGEGGLHGTLIQNSDYAELPLAIYWFCLLIFYGFGEEIGWRGFALPLLQNRYSAIYSSIIVSVLWAIWHLPLFWFSAGFSSYGIGSIIGWYAGLLTGSILLSWLINHTRGSIFLAAGFHATMNVAFTAPISELAITLIGGLITVWAVAVLGISKAQSTDIQTTLLLQKPSYGG